MKPILGDTSAKAAICHLQALVRGRFGKVDPVIKGSGECTICICPDHVILTDETATVIAVGPAPVARALGRKKK